MRTLHPNPASSTPGPLRAATVLFLLGLVAVPLQATPSFGFSSQTFRGRIAENVSAHEWMPSPLFALLIQSSRGDWGIDVVQGTTVFAPMDASGRPSQSGWHDHPTFLSIGLVVEGTLSVHEKPTLHCLKVLPAGSVFFERAGQIHNNYNMDPRVATVVRIIHFIERNQAATRRDQPDQVTGDPATASAPPSGACPESVPAAASDLAPFRGNWLLQDSTPDRAPRPDSRSRGEVASVTRRPRQPLQRPR